jgi:pyruvate,water dikinase
MRQWLKKQATRLQEKKELRRSESQNLLKARYHVFRSLLASNNRAVDTLTEIAIQLRLRSDSGGLVQLAQSLIAETADMVSRLENLAPGRYRQLFGIQQNIAARVRERLKQLAVPGRLPFILPLRRIKPGMESQTGNKAAALAELRGQRDFRVPDGFVVTLAGCRFFLEHAGLSLRLVHELAAHGADRKQAVAPEAARKVQELIKNAELPPALAEEISSAAGSFFENGRAFAVRSSSSSEDSRHHSFAGQFSSVLNVRGEEQLFTAFKEVVASNFNARCLAYRLTAGLDPLHFDLAVLFLEMVEVQSAGVLLTRSPQESRSGRDLMLVSAVPGLGEAAVAGSAAADLYFIGRDGTLDRERSTIAGKDRFLSCREGGGVAWQAVAAEDRQKPVLSEELLRLLAAWGRSLEEMHGLPQDIEWAVDREGRPVILQVRPLTTMGGRAEEAWQAESPPLLAGIAASGGRATGRVRRITRRRDFDSLPHGPVVLVMHQSFVDAVNLLGMVSAILVDLGSPADHLACVAREQQTPLVCGLRNAGETLEEGRWITVDGNHGKVHAATAEEINQAEEAWKDHKSPAPAIAAPLPPLYLELQELVTALHLTDAYGPTFSILECRSLHDIIRYVHEKGVLSMFDAGDEILEGNLGVVHPVDSPVPFFVSVIDLGGGLAPDGVKKRRISPEIIICRPFQALWRGITTPGLHWGPPPGGAPMGSVVSSWLTDQKSERPIGLPNYALVSRDYCNMNARMDFHFIMIDAVCGLEPRSNHIRFRFKGGGTSLERRRRRALCVGEIFEHYGFFVDVRDDLVNASLQGAAREAIEEKLVMVGRILGFTRLLDAAMTDDRMIQKVSEAFETGDYALSGIAAFRKQE